MTEMNKTLGDEQKPEPIEKKVPLKEGNLEGEISRTYEYVFLATGQTLNIKIELPVRVWYGKGHAFHRVQDKRGRVHLCHAPGPICDCKGNIVALCKISWEPADPHKPVQW
jgi:hypothetical protein